MQTKQTVTSYDYYKNKPQVRFTLESAYQLDSKTRQFPFVIASELSSVVQNEDEGKKVIIEPVNIFDLIRQASAPVKEQSKQLKEQQDITQKEEEQKLEKGKEELDVVQGPSRQFLIFHDVEHYLNWKDEYPNCHEIIRCPSHYSRSDEGGFKEDKEDLCKGRLIFDFDCKVPLNCLSPQEKKEGLLVPSIFKSLIEHIILEVFKTYYIGLDLSKLLFVWQITKYDHKFSMHLIVKNAYFNEYWITQMRIFYELMVRKSKQMEDIIYFSERNGVNERIVINPYYILSNTLDMQIPRKNATLRVLGCSKIGGLPKQVDSCRNNGIDLLDLKDFKLEIYDCLVGIYHVEHLRQEQQIFMTNLNYINLQDEIEESMVCEQTKEEKRFQYVINNNISLMRSDQTGEIDLDDQNIAQASELFEAWNDGSFVIRDQVGDIINLNRVKKLPCRISGKLHDRENGYLKLRSDGKLHFGCRRGCSNNGKYVIDLGFYKTIKRPEGIMPININKFKQIKDLKMTVRATPDVLPCVNSCDRWKTTVRSSKISCKKVQVGVLSVVQVPNSLRIK
jgi:hypothetical protein